MFGFGNKKLRAELAEARELAESWQVKANATFLNWKEAEQDLATSRAELSAIKAADAARRARKAETDNLRREAKKVKAAAMDELIASTAGEI